MMLLMVKLLGVCPECKKNIVKKIGDTNHYYCDKCGATMMPVVKWKILQKGVRGDEK